MSDIKTLHILNKPPEHPRTQQCLEALNPGDALLLIENAVLAITMSVEAEVAVPVFALAPDVVARGLGQSPRAASASLVDFPVMVNLTASAQNVISW